jgi:hypothetical protein
VTNYTLVTRTTDNSDGIYDRAGNQVISLRELERRGYSLRYLLGCMPKRISEIAQRMKEQS